MCWTVKEIARSMSRSSDIFAVSAFFHKWTRHLTGFCLHGTMLVSTKTVSWSLRPGHGMHLFNKEGRLLMKMSRVLVPRVGKSTSCSAPMSNMVSRKVELICAGLLWADVLDVFQSMSGKFASPPIHMTEPWYVLARFLAAEHNSSV